MTAGDCLFMTKDYNNTRKTAILSRKIRNLIRYFLTDKFSNTFKDLKHSARKRFKSSNWSFLAKTSVLTSDVLKLGDTIGKFMESLWQSQMFGYSFVPNCRREGGRIKCTRERSFSYNN